LHLLGENAVKITSRAVRAAILPQPMPPRPGRAGLLVLLMTLTCAATAQAHVGPAITLDGPAPEVLELGGVAMAEDGTGGLVYRRTDAGHTHVFAARFDGTRWLAPQRVDSGQPYNSAWPRIGAANGGRLVVTWTQDGGDRLDSLWSAALPRGRSRFLAPTLIDFTVGEDLATYPSIAMDSGGAALIAYRAIRSFSGGGLPAGYISGEVRLARFDGSRWQRIGVPANRNRAAPQRAPTAANAPKVALEANGNGVVVWQEPDDDFVDRIWARRVFGARMGVPLAASPLRQGGQLVRGGADQPALAETDLGRAVVAFRQLPDPRDRASAAVTYVNEMPESGTPGAGAFKGPQTVGLAGGAAPSLAIAGGGDALLAYPRTGSAMLAYRPAAGPFAVRPQGEGLDATPPVAAAGVDGRGVLAAATGAGGGEVGVRRLDGTTVREFEPVFAPLGGPVRELAIAGTGRGDAIVGFAEGADGDRQISAAVVDAAPTPFTLTLPLGWTRARRPGFSWERSLDSLGPVTYTVWVDGRRAARTRRTRLLLREGVLRQGSHRVKVVARDDAGQHTTAGLDSYAFDLQMPLARLERSGRRLSVRISDPGGRRASGPRPRASSVDWGDGRVTDLVTRKARHRYSKAGSYRITIVAVDRAGNRKVVRRRIGVR
jgi:hypothetical protein